MPYTYRGRLDGEGRGQRYWSSLHRVRDTLRQCVRSAIFAQCNFLHQLIFGDDMASYLLLNGVPVMHIWNTAEVFKFST